MLRYMGLIAQLYPFSNQHDPNIWIAEDGNTFVGVPSNIIMLYRAPHGEYSQASGMRIACGG